MSHWNDEPKSRMSGGNKTYIGDGVYASHDGYQIWVEAERDGMVHSVALELSTMVDLVKFAESLWPGLIQKKSG